ncbi:hypothetical protein [Haliscomenobacter sp.]|uniref:hypothetical protein n=1 Tax=Haliscomenobacter sp. TaxID=2717303 RepID=UPI0035939332
MFLGIKRLKNSKRKKDNKAVYKKNIQAVENKKVKRLKIKKQAVENMNNPGLHRSRSKNRSNFES